MILSNNELHQLACIAADAAQAAGAFMMGVDRSALQLQYKDRRESLASQVVTEVDKHSQALILDYLQPTQERYGLGLCSEELEDDGSRLTQAYFWCVDPLDGTLPFIQGRAGFSVSIALIQKNGVPVIGVVYDPVKKVLYQAIKGGEVLRNGQRLSNDRLNAERPCLQVYGDCSLDAERDGPALKKLASAIAAAAHYQQVDLHIGAGGALSACWALEHAPALYYKVPGLQQGRGAYWDFAASACIFNAVGAVVTDFYGDGLHFNHPQGPGMPDRGLIYTSHVSIADALRRYSHPGL
jgi:fructose-1,6-bisphosphatase/inositol monophosphatase family enzyme